MRLALPLFVFSVVSYIATAQEAGENQVYNYYPHYGPNARLFITSTTTTTTVSTSTSTVVCTKLVANLAVCAAARRRRGLLHDEDHQDEQFLISPSAVQSIETSEAVPSREARAANPQYLMVSPYGFYPQEIQSGFYGTPYNYGSAPLPYYGPYAQPFAGNRIFLSTIFQAVLPPFLKQTSTVTSTLTAFTVSTSTSTPACKPLVATLPTCP